MDNYDFNAEFDKNLESQRKYIAEKNTNKRKSTMGDIIKKMNLNRWDVLGKKD